MRRARSLVPVVVVAALLCGACTSEGARPPDGGPPSSLFTIDAGSGSFADTGSGRVVLTLDDVGATVVRFTDRPARQASTVALDAFVRDWPGLFASDPPNAALVLSDPARREEDTVVVTLLAPKVAPNGGLSFDATLVSDVAGSAGLSFVAANADGRLPERFTGSSLFIDGANYTGDGRATTATTGRTGASAAPTSSASTTTAPPPRSAPEAGPSTTAPPCPSPPPVKPAPPGSTAAFYVTFSGEANKGVCAPINQVLAFTAAGEQLAAPVLTGFPSTVTLDELRGMAFGPDGSFYVANGHKGAGALLQFSATVNGDGSRNMVGTSAVADQGTWPGLSHPYGIAFGSGNTYLTTQDTYLGLWFCGSMSLAAAPWVTQQKTTVPFFAGTFAPGDVSASGLPAPVSSGAGGLKGPRDVAYAAGQDWILVADNADASVKAYHAHDGTYVGKVLDLSSSNGAPVGLVVAGDTLFVSNEGTNLVVAVSLTGSLPATPWTVAPLSGQPTLDHPSGLALVGSNTLLVNDREGQAVNSYTLSTGAQPAATAGSVLVTGLTDQPEQIVAVPAS